MKVLAGSLNVEVDAFLHAGYLSAGGRPFDRLGDQKLTNANTKVIDVKQSLELKNDHVSSDQMTQFTTVENSPRVSARASLGSEGFLLGVVILFFVCLVVHYWRRLHEQPRPALFRQLFVAVPSLLILVGGLAVYRWIPMYEIHRLNGLPPPWADTPRLEYKDPEAATQAIMHGLVVNSLPGCPSNVERLGAIRNEVSFPLPAEQWTPGMAYAAKTFGIDGWGNEFVFKRLTAGRFRIASAGPDGRHGTEDDLVLVTPKTDFYNWEQLVNGVYVLCIDEQYACFVHRVFHRNFRSLHPDTAKDVTGTDMFDLLWFRELHWMPEKGGKPDRIVTEPEGRRASDRDAAGSPLFFVQIVRTDDA